MSDEDSLAIWTILSDVVTFAKNNGIIGGDHEANTHLIFADIQTRRANLSDPMVIDPSLHTDGMTSPMDNWLRTTDTAFVRNVETVNRQLSRPTMGGLSVLIYLKNEPDWIGTELCYVDCNGNRFAYRPKNSDVIVFNNRTEHGRCMRNIVGNPGEDHEHKSRVLLRFRISFMYNQDGTPPVVPGQCDRYLAPPALA